MKTGIELIAKERQEQIDKHGYLVRDDTFNNDECQLAVAAEMLLASVHEEGIDSKSFPEGWNEELCYKILGKSYEEKLIIAGALIAAEIDRLNFTK